LKSQQRGKSLTQQEDESQSHTLPTGTLAQTICCRENSQTLRFGEHEGQKFTALEVLYKTKGGTYAELQKLIME
jgi:hypothetical protein